MRKWTSRVNRQSHTHRTKKKLVEAKCNREDDLPPVCYGLIIRLSLFSKGNIRTSICFFYMNA